jgi:2'-5' RNA ligase
MSDLPEAIRAFIAVRIPDFILDQLAAIQNRLKEQLRDVSWTRREAMHITLQFLGKIESANVPQLHAALLDATHDTSAFELALAGLGSFGNRALWVGVGTGTERLKELARLVRSAAQPFAAHEEERPFNPHVTLGRSHQPGRGVAAALRNCPQPIFPSWKVSEFELIRSELSSKGARYSTLATLTLRSEPDVQRADSLK